MTTKQDKNVFNINSPSKKKKVKWLNRIIFVLLFGVFITFILLSISGIFIKILLGV